MGREVVGYGRGSKGEGRREVWRVLGKSVRERVWGRCVGEGVPGGKCEWVKV